MPRYVGGNTTGVKIRPMDKELLFDGFKLPIDKFIKRYESAGKNRSGYCRRPREQILPFIKGDLKDEYKPRGITGVPPGSTQLGSGVYKPYRYWRKKGLPDGEQKPGVIRTVGASTSCSSQFPPNGRTTKELVCLERTNHQVYREGKDYKLPNGTAVQFDRSRPIKAVVERYASMSRPPTTPGILNLPPGTQTKKEEPPAEVTSLFGKLEECEPSRVASYEADMAKRLRGGKEIPDTPNAKKTRLEQEEDMDVDEDILAIANKDYDPFPGYKEAQEENQKEKRNGVILRRNLAISNGVTESFKKKSLEKRYSLTPRQINRRAEPISSPRTTQRRKTATPKAFALRVPLGYNKIGINGKEVQALLDNGSMVNVLPKELAVKLGLIVTERTMNLKGIGGHKRYWGSPKAYASDREHQNAPMKYVEAGGKTLSINDDDGRTYLVPIITPTNQKWETSFPTNTTNTSTRQENQTATEKITEERLKVVNFGPKDFLWTEELKLMKHVIVKRQGAFAFAPEERGCLSTRTGEPYIIPAVPHSPWQQKPIPIAQAIKGKFIELVRERIRTGLYEQSCSSYSSPVFCVKKQDGNLRVVHDLQRLNRVTIKDAGLPPAPEDLIESFTGRACYGLGDIMGGYDERELSLVSRPLTTFETPLGRFQLTRLPQGATNSVAVYQAQMMWILQEEIPENVGIFIDDGGIKGPVSDYDQEVLAENPGIRRFIWEYAIILERVLFRIEEAGLTVSGKNSHAAYLLWSLWDTWFARTAEKFRLNNSTKHGLGLDGCVPRRIQFAKENRGARHYPKKIDYSERAGKIKLAVDSSHIAAGAVLTQEHEGKDRPVLYESVVFSPVESRYSQSKLELCGVAKILKKLQSQLWGQHFELLIDAKSLIEMINSPSLPNAPMTRWVAFIQLFSFDLRHVPGKTFTMPDGLSRRAPSEDETPGQEFNEDESWIKPHPGFGVKEVNTLNLGVGGSPFEQEGVWDLLQKYLTNLRRPNGCTDEEWKSIKHKSETFFISDGKLKRRKKPFPQVVISSHRNQKIILDTLHEELGHRGVEETYRRCKLRFWWPNMRKNVIDWVKSCKACQKRSLVKPMELKHATGKSTIFGRVSMDVVHIKAGKWKYLLVARDDLSGWVEAVGLEKLTAAKVASWFQENWIHRYGLPWTVAMDGGGEFGKEVQNMLKKSGSVVKITTPYYPEANGMIERGHQPLKDALVKMCGSDGKKWRNYLPLVLFADRISTKRTTGHTPYELIFGQPAVLPIDLEMETYLGTDWDTVKTTADLLLARVGQLERREEVLQAAYKKMKETRSKSVEFWNNKGSDRGPIAEGELVLVYNKSLESQWGKLFENRWNGPYRVVTKEKSGAYALEELDGTPLKRRYAAPQVKIFRQRAD
ncbi:hypothetical protein PSTT_11742 [Puccinia striiformis]|uniref:Integrase catalytic domain-containing protein n=1 Tax=Puccinia striiformis TaxID=27350 RepID=A0A2S4UZ12_9BASI|nr:hypothetical protein PSTT_11742 [Puccinia striiformis]